MKKIKEKKSIKLNIFLGFCLTIVTFFLIINIIPPKKVVDHNPFVIKEGSKPLIAAHRGGKYLNPENTLKAINYSVNELDVDILEFDLCLTKDNHLVLNHNLTINDCSDVEEDNYKISEHTLSELQQFNFGYNFIPQGASERIYQHILDGVAPENRSNVLKENELRIATIEEIFEIYSTRDILYIIEIKDSGERGLDAVDVLAENMIKYNVTNKVVVGTFHDEVSNHLKTKHPNIMRGASVGDVTKYVFSTLLGVRLFDDSSFSCLQLPPERKAFGINVPLDWNVYIDRAHRQNMSVQYWTINEKEEMKRLINLGADVIMTDCPDVAYELLKEMGY